MRGSLVRAPAPARGPRARGDLALRLLGPLQGDGQLHVYFFDVGQGDAALVVSPTGKTVLVDAGPESAAPKLLGRLSALLHERLDLVVRSHPHANHQGGLAPILTAIGARRMLDPALGEDGEEDAPLREAVAAQKVEVFQPVPDPEAPAEPLRIGLGGGAELAIYWPRVPVEALLPAERFAEPNSVVMRVSFGRTAVLFTGDATAQTERYLLEKRFPLKSTLLKVASHGADRASTAPFLEQVQPRAAVISVGPGNALRAPAKAALERLEQAGARVFRTDLDGDLHASSDGETFTIVPERATAGEPLARRYALADPPPAPLLGAGGKAPPRAEAKRASAKRSAERFVASRNGQVFHLPECRNAKRIHPQNLLTFSSREAAMKGRRPADDCHP